MSSRADLHVQSQIRTPLRQHLSAQLQSLTDDILDEFVLAFKKAHDDSIVAVVFYGSCRRTRVYDDAVLDFYVIVDSYHHAYRQRWQAWLNQLLPPNVFFLQVHVDGKTYQAKYAIVSQKHLERRTSTAAFHPYFWARFAQPIAVVFVRNDETRAWLVDIQQQSIQTLLKTAHHVLPAQGATLSSGALWGRLLRLTYATELRAESQARADTIYRNDHLYYDGITATLYAKQPVAKSSRLATYTGQLQWTLRNGVGKLLSAFRLLKALTTFTNGPDYIVWKINRHTGETIHLSDRLRKYPWLFCWPILLRLIRDGKVR